MRAYHQRGDGCDRVHGRVNGRDRDRDRDRDGGRDGGGHVHGRAGHDRDGAHVHDGRGRDGGRGGGRLPDVRVRGANGRGQSELHQRARSGHVRLPVVQSANDLVRDKVVVLMVPYGTGCDCEHPTCCEGYVHGAELAYGGTWNLVEWCWYPVLVHPKFQLTR